MFAIPTKKHFLRKTGVFALAVLLAGVLWALPRQAMAIAPNAVTNLIDDGNYTSSTTTLSASWDAAIDDGTITDYSYSIGTAAGLDDVVTWTSVGTSLTFSDNTLTLTPGQQYFINVRASDDELLDSPVASSDGITVDTSAPADITGLIDDGATQTDTTTLSASWDATSDAESGVTHYEYSIGTTAGGTDVVNWTQNGTNITFSDNTLTLSVGSTYFINVRAVNGAGVASNPVSTDGIDIVAGTDTTPPVAVAGLIDDGATQTDTTTLSASWDAATDPESTITEYSYSIGTTAGAEDVKAWTSVGTALTFSDNTLTLSVGSTYFINVRALNSAGLESATSSTDGIDVVAPPTDTTPPTEVTNLMDGGSVTTSLDTLTATWDAATDPESTITEYSYSIGTSIGAEDVKAWTSVGTALTVTDNTLTLTDGTTYFINVRALNSAGLESTVASTDGILVNTTAASDTTPPTDILNLMDGGTVTTSLDTLTATWDASTDAESGVAEYSYSIGTAPGLDDVKTWTTTGTATTFTDNTLTLTDATTYFINVKGVNAAGLETPVASTDGITVNTAGASDTTSSTGVFNLQDGGQFTASLDTLTATWDPALDAESGVADYSYSVGTTAGGTDVKDWTSTGGATTFTDTTLTLTDGSTYFINIIAINGAGLESPVESTDGIAVNTAAASDTTPPTDVTGLVDAGATTVSTTSLGAQWDAATDDESGIREYQYSIGTAAGLDDVRTWTSAGTALFFTDDQLSLTDATDYFINVKAINGANLESGVVSTDGITVNAAGASDTTSPSAVTNLQDGGLINTSTTTLTATWDAAFDDDSGITVYLYSIGATAGDTDVKDWTTAGPTTSLSDDLLTLTDGTEYFINIKAINGAGLEGPVESTDGITVNLAAANDTTPPSDITLLQDEGDTTLSTDSLSAFWEPSTDAESGINRYEFSIGTTAGADDVKTWTSAGVGTFFTEAGLPLAEGVTYFINVKAINGAGLESGVASTDGISVSATGGGGGTGGTDNPTGQDSFGLTFTKNFWNLVTWPIDGSTADVTALGDGRYNLFGYDPEKTADDFGNYYTPTGLALGEGFFVYAFDDDLTLAVSGALPATTGPIEKILKTGWNVVGSPRDADLALNSLKVKDANGTTLSFADAVSAGLVESRLFGYGLGGYLSKDPGSDLERRKGYFINATQPVTLVWEHTTPRTAAAALDTDVAFALKVRFRLESGGQFDDGDTLGFTQGTLPAARLAVSEPPASPGGKVSLTLQNGGKNYAVLPVEKSAGAGVWTLRAESPAPATLTWNSRTPTGCVVNLVPVSGGAGENLAQNGALTVPAGVTTFTVSANCLGAEGAGVAVTRTLSAPVTAVFLAGNLTAQQAAGLRGYRMDKNGDYQEVDLTRDLTGPTPVLLVGGSGASVPTRVSAAASVEVPLAEGWNLVSNMLSAPIGFNARNIGFKTPGGAVVPLNQAQEWVDDTPWLLGPDGDAVEIPDAATRLFQPGESFIVYSNGPGTLVLTQ